MSGEEGLHPMSERYCINSAYLLLLHHWILLLLFITVISLAWKDDGISAEINSWCDEAGNGSAGVLICGSCQACIVLKLLESDSILFSILSLLYTDLWYFFFMYFQELLKVTSFCFKKNVPIIKFQWQMQLSVAPTLSKGFIFSLGYLCHSFISVMT